MDSLSTVFPESEKEAIGIFTSEYGNSIDTPDNFCVICKNPIGKAIHICGGAKGNFQSERARRILWPKYILMHPEERIVLLDNSSKNLIFFFERPKIKYAVVCRPLKNGQLDLISGFIVTGKRAIDYKKGRDPYSFYKTKSC